MWAKYVERRNMAENSILPCRTRQKQCIARDVLCYGFKTMRYEYLCGLHSQQRCVRIHPSHTTRTLQMESLSQSDPKPLREKGRGRAFFSEGSLSYGTSWLPTLWCIQMDTSHLPSGCGCGLGPIMGLMLPLFFYSVIYTSSSIPLASGYHSCFYEKAQEIRTEELDFLAYIYICQRSRCGTKGKRKADTFWSNIQHLS